MHSSPECSIKRGLRRKEEIVNWRCGTWVLRCIRSRIIQAQYTRTRTGTHDPWNPFFIPETFSHSPTEWTGLETRAAITPAIYEMTDRQIQKAYNYVFGPRPLSPRRK